MPQKIIAQGAEALIINQGNKIIKRRIKKLYRLEQLDEKLRKQRTKQEARIMEKISSLISVPKILKVNEQDKEIIMEFIKGKKLSIFLDNLKNKEKIMQEVGKETAKLHNEGIIHGDLTTSNMILADKNPSIITPSNETNNKVSNIINSNFKIFIIDFGLGYHSNKIEDKAVDIHLLKQALEARHFKFHTKLFSSFLKGYKTSNDYKETLARLEKVEARGRYKH